MAGSVDVAVLGLGPAGRAVANRCLERGLTVTAIDLHPHRTWTATYGAWADELPTWLSPDVIAARVRTPSVWGTRRREVPREYVTLDTAALHATLDVGDAELVAGTVLDLAGADDSWRVTVSEGRIVNARTVIDARGVAVGPTVPEQTAYGVVVPAPVAAPALGGADAWFMDWRRDNGTSERDSPSFLYAIPLGGDRVLLEETCLIGRPGLPLGELAERLRARLAARGVALTGSEPVERVRFAVRPAASTTPVGVIAFGARGGALHPATGYSVAASLRGATHVAAAIGDRRETGGGDRRSRTVRRLRALGSDALLALPPTGTAEFFDAFFALPVARQRSYLSGPDDLAGVGAAMLGTFRKTASSTRSALIRAVVGGIVTDR